MGNNVKNAPPPEVTWADFTQMWNERIGEGTPGGQKITRAEAQEILDRITADGVTDGEIEAASRMVRAIVLPSGDPEKPRLPDDIEALRAALGDKVVDAMRLDAMDEHIRSFREAGVPQKTLDIMQRLATYSTWADQALRIAETVRAERELLQEAAKLDEAEREAAERAAPTVAAIVGNLSRGLFNPVTDEDAAGAAKKIWEAKEDTGIVVRQLVARGEKDDVNYLDRLLDQIDEGDDRIWLGRLAQGFVNYLNDDPDAARLIRDKLSPDSFRKLEMGAKMLDEDGQGKFSALFLR